MTSTLTQIKDQVDNLILSGANPWVRYRLVSEFAGFPNSVSIIIVGYLQIFKFLDWINRFNFSINNLAANPNAVLAGVISDFASISKKYLVANPQAFDYIKQHADEMMMFSNKWENPKVVEWLFSSGFYPGPRDSYIFLGRCRSKLAIDWLLNNTSKSDAIQLLSSNDIAIDVLRQNMDLIDRNSIWGNSAAVDILKARIDAGDDIQWHWLSRNSSPWAIDLLHKNQNKIAWEWFAENPGIFEIVDHPEASRLINILSGTS